MKKTIYLLLILLVISSACNKTKSYFRDLTKFVTDVELNYKTFSKEEWIKKDKEFNELSETRFNQIRDNLSPEERSLANEMIGKYKALKLKSEFGDIKEQINDIIEQGKSVVKELLPDSV